MATIKYITTPDGVTHNIGGGGGSSITYSISLGAVSSNTVPLILTGSNGTTDTVYLKGAGSATMSVSGDTMTITTSSGQTITYTFTGAGDTTTYTITATPSSGTAQTVTIPAATTSSAGLMTSADKTKLNGIESGAEANVQADWNQTDSSADDYIKNKPTIPSGVVVDSALSTTSANPVENRVITNALNNKVDKETGKGLSTNDFTTAEKNKLAGIQAGAEQNVQADWNEADTTADDYIKNKPTLSAVATSGDYDDLTNKPTIPTVNDGTLTIQKNGTTIDTFTANQSGNTTVNVTVPTATSQLTNDSGYLTSESDPVYSASPASGITSSDISNWNDKQDELVSGTNIKTINGTSILGSGNITTPDDDTTYSLSKSGGTVTLTGSDGSTSSVTVPTATSDLTNDSNFVSDANYVHTDNNFTNADVTKLNGIEAGAEVNVQADWNQTDSSADDYIKNKPIIPPGSVIDPALDPDSSNAVANSAIVAALDTKVDKVTGMGLSQESFTTAEKTKLSGIATGAEVNVQANWNEANTSSDAYIQNKPTIPTATSELTNDSNFVSDANYVHTDNNYTTADATKVSDIADYVIEEGTSGSWQYRKWNNGNYECWTTLTPTQKAGTSYNGMYYATYTVNTAFPITFLNTPEVIASCRSATMGFLGDITVTASQITRYDMYRAGGGNVGSALSVFVIGRWK